jgi:hypothetical protein
MRIAVALFGLLAVATLGAQPKAQTYEQLITLFKEWRTFEEPPRIDGGVPDYTPATNARRFEELRRLQARLQAIDTTGWSIPQQVDHHLVRAEMNGMEYHLRVLQPFVRDPAYYASIITAESDTPAKEGPVIHGAIKLYDYPIWPRTRLDTVAPLSPAQVTELTARLRGIPVLLQHARRNLASATAKDLWVGGVRAFEEQSAALAELAKRANPSDRGLVETIAAARTATDQFATWLQAEAPKRSGASGIGKEQYTWYLRNVLLVPLSWDEEVTILRRELARAHASLRLEENRNRNLPPLEVADTLEEYDALQARAIPRYLKWVADNRILTIEPWMERALRERTAPFAPEGSRNFFMQATQRDPIPLWTHLYHWWDNMRIRVAPHANPIRRGPLLYNVWMSRAERHGHLDGRVDDARRPLRRLTALARDRVDHADHARGARTRQPLRPFERPDDGAGRRYPRQLDTARVDAARPAAWLRATPVSASAGLRRQLHHWRPSDGRNDR